MNINTLLKSETYNYKYWKTRILFKKHNKKVGSYVDLLFKYYKNNLKYDFTFINEDLLLDLITYSKKYSPFYKKILENFKKYNKEEFEKIPFLTKEIIRENEHRIKSKNIPNYMFFERKTGGSTGEPLSFWAIGNTEMHHQSFLFNLFDYKEGDKILAMDGTKIEDNLLDQFIYWKVKNNGNMLPYGGMALSSLYLNEKNIIQYINFINEYKPDFIRGYPAFIAQISNYIIENGLLINFKIKGVIVTSELCLEEQAVSIKKAFGTKVIGQYGHTEASVFGYTIDDTMIYYCSPLYGFTEIIHENGTHVNEGEEGEIVVTGFSSFGFPLIRYKTGDIAIYGGTIDGIVILKKVIGRTADYVVNSENSKVLLTALVFGQHYFAFSRIKRWQIIQDKVGWVTLIIEKVNDFTIEDEIEIQDNFQTIGKIKTIFKYDNSFIKAKNGKMKFVIQNLNIH